MNWGVAIVLSFHAVLVGWIGWRACPSPTELGHMVAAVYFWQTLRFDVSNVNPPLTRMVSGMPVVLCDPKYDWTSCNSRREGRPELAIGRDFVVANTAEKGRWYFVLGRWSLIPLLLLGGYFGHRLSRELYGLLPGLIFLALWCFSPLLLGWGATICPDASAAGLGLVAIYKLRQWLQEPTWLRAVIAGVCLGLLPLTKLTWIIAFGLWPAIWFVWVVLGRATRAGRQFFPLPPVGQLVGVLLLGLYTLNMGYLFDETCRPLRSYAFVSRMFGGQGVSVKQYAPSAGNRFAGTWLGAIPVPLPAQFVQGMDTQRYDFEQGLPSYLRGEWADHGWWYYYLYVLVVKEPLGTWCLVGMAVGVTLFGRGYSASWRDELVVLLPFFAILGFVSSQTGFSVHSRYIIPALPLLFVWTSKVGLVFEMRPFTRRRIVLAATVLLALTSSVGSSLWAYPHSLSYFSEIVGGPKGGPKHLLGSNVDWGQDMFYLKGWLDRHPEVKLDGLIYYGLYPATLAEIPEAPHPPPGPDCDGYYSEQSQNGLGPKPGWYALSVNYLYGRSRQYFYFLSFEPVAMAGYSIYIYHVTLEDANRVRRELGLPVLSRESG